MGDGRLPLHAADLCVQVRDPVRRRIRQLEHALRVEDADAQVVIEGAIFMILRDEEQLCVGAAAANVCCYET